MSSFKETINEIKSKLSCVEYARQNGLPIKKAGDRCVSPLRPGAKNKTSFVVHDAFWYDFGAGEGGDVIDLAAALKFGGDKGKAIRDLGLLLGVDTSNDTGWKNYTQRLCNEIEYYHKHLTKKDRDYLHGRGITDKTIDSLKIGRTNEGRLCIPYWKNGYICYYVTRAMEGGACPDSKYMKMFIGDGSLCEHTVWGLQTLEQDKERDTLVIAEGAFDAMSFAQEGYPVISAITGHFSREQLPSVLAIAKMFKRVFLVYDNDERTHAGEKFSIKMTKILIENRIPCVVGMVPDGYKDVSEYYENSGDLAFIVSEAVEGVKFLKLKGIDKEEIERLTAESIWDKLDVPPLQTDTWTVDVNGVSHTVVKNRKTGETETTVVTPTPIVPVAYIVNSDTGACKVEIHYLYNDQRCSIICEKEITLNKNKIMQLTNRGINITSSMANELTKYFSEMESLNIKRLPHYSSTNHMGWNGSKFVPYDSDIKFDGEDENRALYQAITQSGDFAEWVEYMRPLRKNLYFRMIMAAAFSAPLLERADGLTYWFHLWGTSGTGKTVALMAAMSIWGNPKIGKMTRTLNATDNALMSTISFLCNLPLGVDELQTIKRNGETYDKIIMQLCEQADRARMKFDTTKAIREWKCSILSTGEEPITQDNSGGGTKNRVIEVEIDNKFFGRQGHDIVGFISDNYGNAGVKFIEYIQNSHIDFDAVYREIYGNIINSVDTTDKQAQIATFIIMADKIACECIFDGETHLTIEELAPFIRTQAETDIAVRAYEWLKDWMATNSKRFTGEGYGEVWGKPSFDNKHTFVIKSKLKRAMALDGYSFEAVEKKWIKEGWIGLEDKPCNIYGKTARCVVVNTEM